jgi:hypothetical protein
VFSSDVRKIGDVDKGIVEGGKDASDAKDEFACSIAVSACASSLIHGCEVDVPSLT